MPISQTEPWKIQQITALCDQDPDWLQPLKLPLQGVMVASVRELSSAFLLRHKIRAVVNTIGTFPAEYRIGQGDDGSLIYILFLAVGRYSFEGRSLAVVAKTDKDF